MVYVFRTCTIDIPYIYHAVRVVADGICMVHVMVYVLQTYTVAESLCASGFQRINGIWYMFLDFSWRQP